LTLFLFFLPKAKTAVRPAPSAHEILGSAQQAKHHSRKRSRQAAGQ